ncbi:hypothetical protein CALVIDRAFT_602069 [Calocera viscosa TUFC12733]|uniref:Uncharacterized protein n=1 Tax=Calocera viscosa (strain TUFC12733) TaxID=1330018 RepID=A0A167HJQ9_CALVF|nr:hypothetical protein CALVIDRAFT_602069 [Calocera viscosa TUFC12733]
MCHNIVYGRLHKPCGCFIAMSTEKKDCNSPQCLFSTSHPPTCRSRNCDSMMNVPKQVPIRISPVNCPDCTRDKGERARINALKDAWRAKGTPPQTPAASQGVQSWSG